MSYCFLGQRIGIIHLSLYCSSLYYMFTIRLPVLNCNKVVPASPASRWRSPIRGRSCSPPSPHPLSPSTVSCKANQSEGGSIYWYHLDGKQSRFTCLHPHPAYTPSPVPPTPVSLFVPGDSSTLSQHIPYRYSKVQLRRAHVACLVLVAADALSSDRKEKKPDRCEFTWGKQKNLKFGFPTFY